jgi:hypothetical protein
MAQRAPDYDAVMHTVQTYIDGTYEGDVSRLKEAFHEKATISGYIQVPNAPPEGVFMFAPIDALYGHIESHPSPKASGDAYAARVGEVVLRGSLARVVVYEDGLGGEDFVNELHLHRVGGKWEITAKAFVGDGN